MVTELIFLLNTLCKLLCKVVPLSLRQFANTMPLKQDKEIICKSIMNMVIGNYLLDLSYALNQSNIQRSKIIIN